MANNLHISYDLYAPGQNYEKVAEAIKSLGSTTWAKIHKSYWYVNSPLNVVEATKRVWAAMDPNDSLYIVDATHNNADWRNIDAQVEALIKREWNC